MTVYNINLGIGWASSGVEYAQAYRSKLFKNSGIPAKFIFTDMFQQANLSDLTRNLGFTDDQIIWLYGAFTDLKIGPTTFTLEDLEAEIPFEITKRETQGIKTQLFCEKDDIFYSAYRCREGEDIIHRVEMVSRGSLIRKDFYSYTKMFTEYYTPLNNKAHLYQRRFFNENGTVAYDEIIDGKDSVFRFKDRILSSKEELIVDFMEGLNLTEKDFVLMDRATGTGQAVLRTVKPAKVGVVVHAEHFSESILDSHTILWNNYYEYQFTNADKIDVFITATDRQRKILAEQFTKYTPHRPRIVTIPVGSLDGIQYPTKQRRPFSVITASRLASEKHVDWLCKAVIKAKETLPELTFDVYGKGGEESKISELIKEAHAEQYIHLMGHKDLTGVYQNYQLYFTASKSEGFGLTLLEAVGSGLGIIGFDVRYGNQTFVKDGQNGYLIPYQDAADEAVLVGALADKLIAYFKDTNLEQVHQVSYSLAQGYLSEKIEAKWQALVKEMTDD